MAAPLFNLDTGYHYQRDIITRPNDGPNGFDPTADWNEGYGKPRSSGHSFYLGFNGQWPLSNRGQGRFVSSAMAVGGVVTFGEYIYDRGWIDTSDRSDPANPPEKITLTNVHVTRSPIAAGPKITFLFEQDGEHLPKWAPSLAVLFFSSQRTDRDGEFNIDVTQTAERTEAPELGFTVEALVASITMGPDVFGLGCGGTLTSDPSIGDQVFPGLVCTGTVNVAQLIRNKFHFY